KTAKPRLADWCFFHYSRLDSTSFFPNATGANVRLLSVRLIVSLILGVTLVSLLSSYYEVQGEKRGLRKELERRAEVLGESLAGNVEPHLERGSRKDYQRK